jgi:Transcriptional regulators
LIISKSPLAFTRRLRRCTYPITAIGARAAELLLDRIAGTPIDEPVVDMGFEIVVRGSTRQIR